MKITAITCTEAESRQGMCQAEKIFAQRARQRCASNKLSLVSSNDSPQQPAYAGFEEPMNTQAAMAGAHA